VRWSERRRFGAREWGGGDCGARCARGPTPHRRPILYARGAIALWATMATLIGRALEDVSAVRLPLWRPDRRRRGHPHAARPSPPTPRAFIAPVRVLAVGLHGILPWPLGPVVALEQAPLVPTQPDHLPVAAADRADGAPGRRALPAHLSARHRSRRPAERDSGAGRPPARPRTAVARVHRLRLRPPRPTSRASACSPTSTRSLPRSCSPSRCHIRCVAATGSAWPASSPRPRSASCPPGGGRPQPRHRDAVGRPPRSARAGTSACSGGPARAARRSSGGASSDV
jgi:hypothetical protein